MDKVDTDRGVPAAFLKSSAKVGAAAGSAGMVIGAVGGVIRSNHPFLFSLVSGMQWFALGSTFWFTRSFLIHETQGDPSRKPFASSVAGALSATVTAALFRGRTNILPGAVIGGAAGFAGQHAMDAWGPDSGRSSKSKPPILERIMRSKWSPLEPLTSEDYGDILKRKLLRVDAELAIIDEDMAKLHDVQQRGQSNPEK